MALGDAFVTVRADTSKFQADLVRQLKVILAGLPDQRVRVTADVTAATRAIKAAADQQERDLAAANKAVIADAKRTAKEIEEAETAAYKVVAEAAKAAAADKVAADKIAAISARESAQDQTLAFNAARDAARLAYADEAAAAAASAKSQAASVRLAYAEMSSGAAEFQTKAGANFSAVGNSIRTFITTPLLAAAAAGGALTVAVGFFGLKMSADLQSAQVGVEGVIAAQEQYNGKLAEGQAAGEKFFDTLKATARLTPFNLQDLASASQQLVAIGLNGEQTIGVVNDIGNALATSGKVTADRLNNAVLAITQINSLGKVTRDNIRQITSNIPTFNQTEFVRQIALLDAIKERGKGATVSTADLTKAQFDLENGLVGSTTGIQAILNTMEKIPGAATAMQRQMNTLAGVTSNFHDTVQQAFGDAFIPQLPKIQSELNDISRSLSGFFAQAAPGVADFIVQLGPIVEDALPSMLKLIQSSTGAFTAFSAVTLPLLPVIATALSSVVGVLQTLTPLVQTLAGALEFLFGLPGFGTAFGIFAVGLFTAVKTVTLATKAFKLFQSAMLAARVAAVFLATEAPILGAALEVMTGPVGIIVAAVAAIAYGFYVAWQRSETFRNIVIGVFNAIITVVGVAVKSFIRYMALYAEAPLHAIDLILKGLSHLPKHFGGGVASGAEGAVSDLIGQIDRWRDSALSAIDDVVQAAKLVPAFADPTGLANADFGYGDNAAANITAQLNAQGLGDPVDKGSIDISGGTTPDPTKTPKVDKAAAAAKAAKAKIKAAFADLAGDLKAIGDHTSEQTAAQIKTNFNALIKDLKDSGHSSLIAGAKAIEDTLIADAKKLAAIDKTLQAELSIAQNVKDAVVGLGSVATPTQGIGVTLLGITNQLDLAIAESGRFADAIGLLKGKLNNTSLKQLVDAGPEAGFAAAQAILLGGQAAIDAINSKEGVLEGIGNKFANAVVDPLYQAGLDAGNGLLNGLKDSEKKIEDEMDHLADTMLKKFDLRLGIKSPSTVMAGRGRNTGSGLVLGLEDSIAPITSAMNKISNAVVNFGPGSIAVNGGVPRPEDTGMMLGQGIVSVLQQRQAQAALNGTG